MNKNVCGGEVMLYEFSCSNHKSIKDEVKLSMSAGSDDSFGLEKVDNHANINITENGDGEFLRSAIIYGGNGSGKSNFLNALKFMISEVVNGNKHEPLDAINQVPHKCASADDPSEYKILFLKNDIRYAYGFSLVNEFIHEEFLYYYPKGKKAKIFERINKEVNISTQFSKKLNNVTDMLKSNKLFLSCAANYSDCKEVADVFEFFKSDIIFYDSKQNIWEQFTFRKVKNDELVKNQYIKLMNCFDYKINDIVIEEDKVSQRILKMLESQEDKNSHDRAMISLLKKKKYKAQLVYDEFTTDIYEEESEGIIKLFELIIPILHIIASGKILVCDELEKGIHEVILVKLLNMFHSDVNMHGAQLIFTSHNSNLLSNEYFRRDQIWFTQLKPGRETELYSLVEIRNVRKSENWRKGYISGKYGGIPILNTNNLE